MRRAVFAGLGLVIATEWLFEPELRSGVVTSVLDDWALPASDLWAVFPSGRQAIAKARAFVHFLETQLTEPLKEEEFAPVGPRRKRR